MIKYCNLCGSPVAHCIPTGDSRLRAVCSQCQHIQYQNPRLIVGCIAEFQEKILLCRRAIEPRHGFWTLPAGFMENGETAGAGAARESLEEACAEISIDGPFALISIAHIDQVHLFYRGRLHTGKYAAGAESIEVALFAVADIPWQELAFTSVRYCLECYLEDRERGHFTFHETILSPVQESSIIHGETNQQG